jgi:hypothetical protein
MSAIVWILFGAVYLACWLTLGVSTLRKGHTLLFGLGIVFPVLWIVGALMPPAPRAGAAVAARPFEKGAR